VFILSNFPGKNGMPGETRRKKSITTLPDAAESYDLRPFIFGDPPKRINWKVLQNMAISIPDVLKIRGTTTSWSV